jgi:hypothetical protein
MRIVTSLFLISLAMLVAVGGLVLVQRLMPTRRRLRHNDVAGFIFLSDGRLPSCSSIRHTLSNVFSDVFPRVWGRRIL